MGLQEQLSYAFGVLGAQAGAARRERGPGAALGVLTKALPMIGSELLGTVYFYADYRLPIDAVREELDRILEGNPKWDERVKNVLVTEVTDRAVQVRALVSARNASDHWDLRCEVREKLVAWLRAHEGGRYLPRMRVEGEEEEGVAGA